MKRERGRWWEGGGEGNEETGCGGERKERGWEESEKKEREGRESENV